MLDNNSIISKLYSLENKRERLCLLVNPYTDISTDYLRLSGDPFINIGQQLSEKLIMISKPDRPVQTAIIFREMIESSTNEYVGLSRLEILFDRELALDPLKLLLANAQEKTVLALWPGNYDARIGLTYAQPSHPEYRFYKPSDISNLLIINIEAQIL